MSRLTNAIAPALEFLSGALKPHAVVAFLMDPDEGRLDLADLNGLSALHEVESSLALLDHRLLRDAAPRTNRPLLVRSAHLERSAEAQAYLAALKQNGVLEVGEFQFEDVGMFVGGISLFWKDCPPAFISDQSFLRPLHDFVQASFVLNWRRTAAGRRHVLSTFLDLTPRECDVMEMLCLGRTNQDAALCLGIGLPTVKTHLGRLFDKFDVENRSALIRRALLSIDNIEAMRAPAQLRAGIGRVKNKAHYNTETFA
ncbi:MAG: helix-turn-helix transcriptional regulator [Alteraurantiacibacter sp.]